MEYCGFSEERRVRIIATSGWLARFNGQECDAVLYGDAAMPQLNTEQLTPPLPKWQSCKASDIEVLPKAEAKGAK